MASCFAVLSVKAAAEVKALSRVVLAVVKAWSRAVLAAVRALSRVVRAEVMAASRVERAVETAVSRVVRAFAMAVLRAVLAVCTQALIVELFTDTFVDIEPSVSLAKAGKAEAIAIPAAKVMPAIFAKVVFCIVL
jgi:hypothetical protein